ncbi:MAG: hypothetical protein FD156_1000 [Nitrospirae bacterium]|nr:MAG: hypothetical protein FD156_1000 [Nitrospirota bacterium]
MKRIRKDNLVYVDDILVAIKKINKFCKGIEKEDFMKNELLMDAVVRNLEIIGEASSKLTAPFRERYKGIEWRKIIGMRNRIIHAYDTVNFEIVWDVVREDLPELRKKLKAIVSVQS